MQSWLDLAKRYPRAVRVNIDGYRSDLDAVDHAVRASLAQRPDEPPVTPFGWGDPVIVNGAIAKITRRPLAPVRADDPTRVAVAAMQRLELNRAAMFDESGDAKRPALDDGPGTFYILRAMVDKLVRRRLPPDSAAVPDMVDLLFGRRHSGTLTHVDDNLSPVLACLDRAYPAALPARLAGPLTGLHQRVGEIIAIRRQSRAPGGRKVTTKRFELARDRVQCLLGRCGSR